MALFHDSDLVKQATFDRMFPDHVARFNNVEDGGVQPDRTEETPPQDIILLAVVEVTEATDPDSLTLVREHVLAPAKHQDFFLTDGNDPLDELGFYRVVHAPPADSTADAGFDLSVRTQPVSFDPPACFQAGKPTEIVVNGLEAPAENWRLRVDNGSVDATAITPRAAGKVTVDLGIDSMILWHGTEGASKDADRSGHVRRDG